MSFNREQHQVLNTIKRIGQGFTVEVFKSTVDKKTGATDKVSQGKLFAMIKSSKVRELGAPSGYRVNTSVYISPFLESGSELTNFLTLMEDPATVVDTARYGEVQADSVEVIAVQDTPLYAIYTIGG